MLNFSLILLNLVLIALTCAAVAYLIMRWSFSPVRHSRLGEYYNGLNISGLNSGAIILLSLGLAFVFSDISTIHSRAKLAVLQEADALRTLGRMTLNLDPVIGTPLMTAARQYSKDVIAKEWPHLKEGKPELIRHGNDTALEPLTIMSDIAFTPENLEKLPVATSIQLSTLVTRIREQRLIRIDVSDFGIGIRGLVLAIVTMLISSVLLSVASLPKRQIQFLSNFLLYLVTATAMYIAYVSQNPFAGLDAVSNAPMLEASERLHTMHLSQVNKP